MVVLVFSDVAYIRCIWCFSSDYHQKWPRTGFMSQMTVPLVPPPTSTHVPPHTGALAFLRRVNGENGSLPSLKEARASTFTEADLEKISRFKPTHGTPKRVHRELTDLASRLIRWRTAAERFFGQKPRSMFAAILDSVEIPPAPLSPPRQAVG